MPNVFDNVNQFDGINGLYDAPCDNVSCSRVRREHIGNRNVADPIRQTFVVWRRSLRAGLVDDTEDAFHVTVTVRTLLRGGRWAVGGVTERLWFCKRDLEARLEAKSRRCGKRVPRQW